MCGEYGEKLGRPHYHYILFGYGFPDKYPWRQQDGNQMWRSPTLEKAWPYGHSEIGAVTFESCAYVARYVMKKITGNQAEDHYRRTDENGNDYWLQPEFNQMSRKPGIARTWWEAFHTDIYDDQLIVNGQKTKPPRYYDELLEKLNPDAMQTIKDKRTTAQLANAHEQTKARLATKETVTKARLQLKKRGYET